MRFFKPNIEKMQEKGDVPGLIKALDDQDESVRLATTKALGQIGDAQAVEPLCIVLQDNNSNVCKAAAETLVALYHGRKLDAEARQKILAVRKTIEGAGVTL